MAEPEPPAISEAEAGAAVIRPYLAEKYDGPGKAIALAGMVLDAAADAARRAREGATA